jgi:ABC-type multidrug transport system ATPase subunit
MQLNFYNIVLKVFAIVSASAPNETGKEAESFLLDFFSQLVPSEELSDLLEEFRNEIQKFNKSLNNKKTSANSVKLMKFIREIESELRIDERHLLVIRLLEFTAKLKIKQNQTLEYVELISDMLGLDSELYLKIREFCFVEKDNPLDFLFLNRDEIYFRINEESHVLNLEDFTAHDILRIGYCQILKLSNGKQIIYSDLLRKYLPKEQNNMFSLSVNNLKCKLSSGDFLFNDMSLSLNCPGMVAVMGPSGAGKSTFLNIISKNIIPDFGGVFSSRKALNILFLPQEDHISVDLKFGEQLDSIRSKYGGVGIKNTDEILEMVGLEGSRERFPGDIQKSKISGGERKRLGIACGLVLEPDVLLCDEPTSGLSAYDAEGIVHVLRDVANQGRIVVCSLHQPEASLINYFDKLLYLDVGGNPVYFGSPSGFYPYVAKHSGRKISDTGMIKIERTDVASAEAIVRRKKTDAFGVQSNNRQFPPKFWSKIFTENTVKAETKYSLKLLHKKMNFSQALKFEMKSFFNRKSYLIFALLFAPVMAVMLSLVCRYSPGDNYFPQQNVHLPIFYMIAIVVAIFGGLVFSISELSRQQSERKREYLIEGNNRKYFIVKLVRFRFISVIQSLLFAAISVWILKLPFLFVPLVVIYYLLMILSGTCGFLISVISRGKTWAYVMIPILLVPQIVFSGAMIPWSKFPGHNDDNLSPIVSRFIPSSWAFEALMTESILRNSEYDFLSDKAYYLSAYYLQEILPVVRVEFDNSNYSDFEKIEIIKQSLPNEIADLACFASISEFDVIDKCLTEIFSSSLKENEPINFSKSLPNIWYFLQFSGENERVKIISDEIYMPDFSFYKEGSLLNDKAAYVRIFGSGIRHFYLSCLMLLIMNGMLLFILLRDRLKWPW